MPELNAIDLALSRPAAGAARQPRPPAPGSSSALGRSPGLGCSAGPDGPLAPGLLTTPGGPAEVSGGRMPVLVPVPESAPPYDDELGPARLAPLRLPPQAAAPPPGGPPAGSPGEPGDWPSRFAQVLAETLAGARPAQQIVPWTTEEARRRLRRLGPQLTGSQTTGSQTTRPQTTRPQITGPQAGLMNSAARDKAIPGGRAQPGGQCPRPVVRRVRSSSPAAGVIEMAAVVSFGPRVRALAIRLEQQPGQVQPGQVGGRPARWRCTALEAC